MEEDLGGALSPQKARKVLQLAEVAERLEPCLASEPTIVALYVFGSFARGRQRPGSDIDLAILLDERDGKPDRKELLGRLIPALSRLLRHDVHLLILNDASYLARMEVLSHGRLIHVKDSFALAEFRMVSTALFADFAPYLRQLQENFKKRLLDGHGR